MPSLPVQKIQMLSNDQEITLKQLLKLFPSMQICLSKLSVLIKKQFLARCYNSKEPQSNQHIQTLQVVLFLCKTFSIAHALQLLYWNKSEKPLCVHLLAFISTRSYRKSSIKDITCICKPGETHGELNFQKGSVGNSTLTSVSMLVLLFCSQCC